MQIVLLNAGAALILLWGLGHLMPTRSVVSGFGEISNDNRHVIMMEWLIEGLTLCFVGILVGLMTWLVGTDQSATILVARACAGFLVVMAIVSAFTGARTSVLPMKLCPVVKTIAAALMLAGTL